MNAWKETAKFYRRWSNFWQAEVFLQRRRFLRARQSRKRLVWALEERRQQAKDWHRRYVELCEELGRFEPYDTSHG